MLVPAPPKREPPAPSHLCPDDFKAKHHDAPSLMREAIAARCRGDIVAARRLYETILETTPDDCEALSGIGDLSRRLDDWDTARNYYAAALRANPSFIPAAVGAADVEWDVANLPIAQRKYHEIMAAFPEGTYPPRVKERASVATPP
jgi:tetratricopeptide (TPR) repeat protein